MPAESEEKYPSLHLLFDLSDIMEDSQSHQEDTGSSSEPHQRLSREEYLSAYKPQGRACGHFTFAWDSHPYCLSCQLWAGKGLWKGLPCVCKDEYCYWCSQWQPSTRAKYSKALTTRISAPLKYQGGRTYVAQQGYNAPLKLLSFLDLEPIYFTGFQSTSDEIE